MVQGAERALEAVREALQAEKDAKVSWPHLSCLQAACCNAGSCTMLFLGCPCLSVFARLSMLL